MLRERDSVWVLPLIRKDTGKEVLELREQKSKKKSYEIDMCSGALLPKILMFSVPLLLSGILQLLFNAADIVVVGRYTGSEALAAVGSTSALINLLVNLFIGLSVGVNVMVAKYYGARREQDIAETVHTAVLTAIAAGAILTVLGVLLARPLLELMGTPEDVIGLSVLYMRIYFLGMIGTLVYNFGGAVLRAIGDTRRPLFILFAAGVVNVIFNLIFVILFHLGVAGTAIATAISQFLSAALVLNCLIKSDSSYRLNLKQLRIVPRKLKEMAAIGVPAGMQGAVFSVSNVLIQSSVNSFGSTVMAGNTAAANIEGFVYASMNAFYQANISFTSQNYGAGRYERIRPILLRALTCAVVTGLVLGGLSALLSRQLLGIYSSTDAVIAAGTERLRIVCSMYFLCGIMDVLVGSLRGLGYSVMPMLVSLMGACVLRLVWLATIFQVPAFHTVQTIYWSYPFSWIVTALVHTLCFLWAMRRLRRHMAEDEILYAP